MGLTIEVMLGERATVARLAGEIDGKTAPEAEDRLLPAIEGSRHVILEMDQVTFCSSAGLRTLLLLYRHAAARDAGVALVGLSEEISDTMSMTGFLDFFVVADSAEAALATLGVGG